MPSSKVKAASKKAARKAAPAKTVRTPRRAAKAVATADGGDPQRGVEQFLYRQAECLDSGDWQGFIDLFAEDGIYWMPAEPSQTTGDGVPSIFYEDRDLMAVRMGRLGHPRAWSQKTAWGTNHVVSNVRIETIDAGTGELTVRSRFHMMEFRNDVSRHFAGSYVHHLRRGPDGYRIRLQRVDMVNAEGTYDYVLQAWV